MTAYLRSPVTGIWMLLTAATFASWWVGGGGESGQLSVSFPITIAVVTIALVKTRLVFWYFMEVRTAPSWLRWNCDGWLAFLAIMICALYGYNL